MASLPTITKFLALFQEVYPIAEFTDATSEAWVIALDDIDDMTFVWAAQRLLREEGRKFFPTPNEVRSYLAPSASRPKLFLPSNDPLANAIDAYYAAQAKASKRITFDERSRT